METKIHTCVYCGKIITLPPADIDAGDEVYCSFGCEVKNLLGGLGWGTRWLGVSLAWGLVLFVLIVLIGWAILGRPIADLVSYCGLIVVLSLMAVILSVLRRRLKP
jgi:hypothetical protein